jgi:hypothetical protein
VGASAQQKHSGFELLAEIVGKPTEELPEHGLRALQVNYALIMGRRKRDVALDGVGEFNVRQNEYRGPINSHVVF